MVLTSWPLPKDFLLCFAGCQEEDPAEGDHQFGEKSRTTGREGVGGPQEDSPDSTHSAGGHAATPHPTQEGTPGPTPGPGSTDCTRIGMYIYFIISQLYSLDPP